MDKNDLLKHLNQMQAKLDAKNPRRGDNIYVSIADTLTLLRVLRKMGFTIERYKTITGEKRNIFMAFSGGSPYAKIQILVDVHNQIEPGKMYMWDNAKRELEREKIDIQSVWTTQWERRFGIRWYPIAP